MHQCGTFVLSKQENQNMIVISTSSESRIKQTIRFDILGEGQVHTSHFLL
jgi:hypothetical protein